MSEVYFNAPNMKVFDVVLNGDLTVSSDLDIFEKVGLFFLENTSISFSRLVVVLPMTSTLSSL